MYQGFKGLCGGSRTSLPDGEAVNCVEERRRHTMNMNLILLRGFNRCLDPGESHVE